MICDHTMCKSMILGGMSIYHLLRCCSSLEFRVGCLNQVLIESMFPSRHLGHHILQKDHFDHRLHLLIDQWISSHDFHPKYKTAAHLKLPWLITLWLSRHSYFDHTKLLARVLTAADGVDLDSQVRFECQLCSVVLSRVRGLWLILASQSRLT